MKSREGEWNCWMKIAMLDGCEDLRPTYGSKEASGLDVGAAVDTQIVIPPGSVRSIPLGFKVDIPKAAEIQLRPRSGWALRSHITILNSPGTIDSDYRGELRAVLINHGDGPVTVNRGDRIAQMVVCPVFKAQVKFVDEEELSMTDRGQGGMGSTGKTMEELR